MLRILSHGTQATIYSIIKCLFIFNLLVLTDIILAVSEIKLQQHILSIACAVLFTMAFGSNITVVLSICDQLVTRHIWGIHLSLAQLAVWLAGCGTWNNQRLHSQLMKWNSQRVKNSKHVCFSYCLCMSSHLLTYCIVQTIEFFISGLHMYPLGDCWWDSRVMLITCMDLK